MKKVIASAVGLMMVGGVAASASAFENQLGGYWRTRAFFQDEFQQNGEDYKRIDNRTRLYYTAKFNDNFKFVNKFEFNSVWGDDDGGDLGADGNTWRVKNSYADFTLGNVNTKLGIQGAVLARGFLFDNDFSGIVVSANSLAAGYIAVRTEDGGGAEFDEGLAFLKGDFQVSDQMSVSPYFVYWGAGTTNPDSEFYAGSDVSAFYLGTDLEMKMDTASVWGTFIYNGGEAMDNDINGFLVAVGVDTDMVHGQAFYASGDDGSDGDIEAFVSAPGQSYYWSEIMGLGTFDNGASAGSPGDAISNIAAFNAGVTLMPAENVKVNLDVWYAMLAEENEAGDDDLGVEFDAKLTYSLMENLNADLVFAYLVAGDATGDEDVLETGVRLSLSF